MKRSDYSRIAIELDQEAGDSKGSIMLCCGKDLKPRPIKWLWQDWLALGKFHLLAGSPGQGKTTIAMSLAAIVTAGGCWPDGSHSKPGNVLIWSGEDDYSDTLMPRLIGAGADLSRVFFVKGTQLRGSIRPFDPATDLQAMQNVVIQTGGVSLIVIDPISTAIVGDSHKNAEVRRGLQPLVDMAISMNATLIGITHFSKGGQGGDPSQRVIGSVAFTAVARVVLVAARVKGKDGFYKHILARSKSNIGPDHGGFEYHVIQENVLPEIIASKVEWGQPVEGSARELLNDSDESTNNNESDTVVRLLKAVLMGDHWTNATDARKGLIEAGYTDKQIWNASKKLKVIRKKNGMNGGWCWRLPIPDGIDFSPEDSEDSFAQKVESL